MSDAVSLSDLPLAWLLRLATNVTSEGAARMRSTCKALQGVIDATWEPVEVAVPPHRRSVPLTFEQVQAQLPPTVEPVDTDFSDAYDEFNYHYVSFRKYAPEQDGCMLEHLETYGPALTRLTANHAVNVLKGKSVLCMLAEDRLCRHVSKHSTTELKMEGVAELRFLRRLKDAYGCRLVWPPKAIGAPYPDRILCHDDIDSHNDSDGDCEWQELPQRWMPWTAAHDQQASRGPYGWGEGYFGFDVERVVPEQSQGDPYRYSDALVHLSNVQCPFEVHDEKVKHSLLIKTDSSCRKATVAEVEFYWNSTGDDDVSMFDLYLSYGGDYKYTADVCVFLAPTEQRLTGQVKTAAAATNS